MELHSGTGASRRGRFVRGSITRTVTAVALLAATVGLGPAATAGAAPLGSEPLETIDSVGSTGAEMAVHVEASDWTPDSGDTVAWTVTVRNRSIAAASAEHANVWFGTGQGTSTASIGPVPDGWHVSWWDDSGGSLWADEPLAPGASMSFVVTTSVSGAIGSTVDVNASASASNQWRDTPRPGRWTMARAVIGGTLLSGSVVSDRTGAPLGDVCVEASGAGWWSSSTRPDGTWDLAVAKGSDVTVRFEPRCQIDHHVESSGSTIASPYAVRWWPGTSDPASAGSVETSSDRSLGAARLHAGGAVSGTVTVPDGHDPSTLWVSVETTDSGWWIEGGPVAPDGTFLVHGLPEGTHVVGVFDNAGALSNQYYDGAGSRHLATPVSVAGGSVTTGVGVEMATAATLSGMVTDAETGAPLSDIDVQVRTPSGEWVNGTSTARDGSYSISGIPAGSYVVRFDDQNGQYLRVFHDGSWHDRDTAPLAFDGGVEVVVDIAMEAGVSATGRVTAAVSAHGLIAGDPIDDVVVLAWAGGFSFDADPVSMSMTDTDGAFTIGGLPPTEVALVFVHGLDVEDDDGMIEAEWAVQFWPAVSDPFQAGTLDLTGASGTVTGIDAELSPAPIFTGRVLDAHGGTLAGSTGLDGMAVALFVPGDGEPFAVTMTESDGSYQLASPFADFDVYVGSADIGEVYDGSYPPRWYGGAAMVLDGSGPPDPVADGATPVRASAGTTRGEVHIVHDPPPAPGPPHLPATIEVEPGDGSVIVRWSSLDLPIDQYVVLVDGEPVVSVDGNGAGAGARGGVVLDEIPMLEFPVDGLTNGEAYEFAVIARNLSGEGTLDTMSATPRAGVIDEHESDGSGTGDDAAGGPAPGGIGLGPVTVPNPGSSPDTSPEPDPSLITVPVDDQPGDQLPDDQVPDDLAEANPPADGAVEHPNAGLAPTPVSGLLPATGGSPTLAVMWALIILVVGLAVVSAARVGSPLRRTPRP